MEPTEESVLLDVFSSDTSGIFVFLLAVIGITGEWRHRTIAGSLLAAPDRRRFLAAKTLAFATVGLALSLAVSTAVAVVGYAFLSARGLPVPAVADVAGAERPPGAARGDRRRVRGGPGRARAQPGRRGGGGAPRGAAGRAGADRAGARGGPLRPLRGPADRRPGLSATEAGLPDVDLLAPGLAWPALLAWVAAAFAAASELLRRRDLE